MSAALRVAQHLDPGAMLESPWAHVRGAVAVVEHVGRRWPLTSVYEVGTWTGPHQDGQTAVMAGEFPRLGAAPKAVTITLTFGQDDRIVKIVEVTEPRPKAEAVQTIPAEVAGPIDGALANGTPVALAYVSGEGLPELPLRGSLRVFSPTELSIWVRNPQGGLVKSVETNLTSPGTAVCGCSARRLCACSGVARAGDDRDQLPWGQRHLVRLRFLAIAERCALPLRG